ncbi:hypothetical protein [Kitasatospora cineracea]|uniref:hypothetical protein n=1 Tax=Kitasatospora cineracea TaxID=88074 RepID=UPI0011CDD798|nr:hypothetical protein [Kitasatospora cineracea]
MSTVVERADFAEPALDEPRLDPQHCLRNLRVVASRHPYDLGPVPPVVDFDPARFKIAADSAVVGPLDSRPGLLRMDPFAGDGFVASRALSRAKRNQPSSWGTGSASNQQSAACGSDGASRRIAVGRGSPEGSGARAAQARIAGSGSVSGSLPAQPDRLGRPLRIRRVRARRRDHLSRGDGAQHRVSAVDLVCRAPAGAVPSEERSTSTAVPLYPAVSTSTIWTR